jgi:LCP family protein required for cell wall assembly
MSRPESGDGLRDDDNESVRDDHGGYVVDTRNRLARSRPRQARSPQERPTRERAPQERPSEQRSPQPDPRARRPAGAPPPGRTRQRRRRRTIAVAVVLVVLLWLAFLVWVPFNAWGNVRRVDNTPAGARPADNGGHNYLLVGSDGREGLTPEQQDQLNAGGGDIGQRTDSIIVVHVPSAGGKAALVSVPRDSYVPIPGHGSNKINAAYSIGGAKLLTQTIEQVTGIHLDGYLEIGFAGFANVVDSLGGVDVCVPFDMKDPDASIDLKQGCQTLDGPTALGYVRARKSDPRGDIGRAERQRQFLGAVLKKAATPSTVLIPWRYKAFADATASGLTVGQTTQLSDAVRILQALRGVDGGDTLSLVVPIETASFQTSNAGVAVKWNSAQAKALFTAIQNDEPLSVPPAGTSGG